MSCVYFFSFPESILLSLMSLLFTNPTPVPSAANYRICEKKNKTKQFTEYWAQHVRIVVTLSNILEEEVCENHFKP